MLPTNDDDFPVECIGTIDDEGIMVLAELLVLLVEQRDNAADAA